MHKKIEKKNLSIPSYVKTLKAKNNKLKKKKNIFNDEKKKWFFLTTFLFPFPYVLLFCVLYCSTVTVVRTHLLY